MGVYLASMFGIANDLYDLRSSLTKTLLFLGAFIAIHSAGLRYALSYAFGSNWAYILEDGVADQRMLGPVFQPSTFGVLIILSIYLFLRSRPYLAVLAAVLAAWLHPTYLLSAAVLTFAYMVIIFREKRQIKYPFALAMTALIVVSPVVIYVALNFGSPSPDLAEEARKILVEFRIPHHAIVSQWLDATTLVKLLLVIATLFVARGKHIWTVLSITTLCAILLTLLQILTKSYTLALIFPWRLSILILPLSVTVLLGSLVTRILQIPGLGTPGWKNMVLITSVVLMAGAVLSGAIRFKIDLERKANEPERAVEAYIEGHHISGDIYLIPTKMEDFRLRSGAPAYVDFKSIPYQDVDVLEWYRRVRLADRFYKNLDCALLERIISEGRVNHIVVEADGPRLTCPGNMEIYRDPNFIVYQSSVD